MQEQWRELVTFCPHNAEDGKKVRFAAEQFAKQNEDDLNWLNSLATPIPREWEVSNAKRKEERQVKKQARHTIHRQQFLDQIEQLRQGEFSSIIRPAQACLGLYNDLDNNLPAHKRIAEWLGNELSEVSLGGISSYLLKNPLEVNADQIATNKAKKKGHYYAEYIFIVAIAERIRNNNGIGDLSDEKLLACLFSTWSRSISQSHAKIGDVLGFLENEVNNRGLLLDAKKRFIEPQLKADNEYIEGLSSLMTNIDISEGACELALEWLLKYHQLSIESERSLLTRLINSEKNSDIKLFISNAPEPRVEKQKWDRHAIQLIINSEDDINDFDESVDAGLIWSFRHFLYLNSNINKKVELIKWLISTFRLLWPNADRPNGVTGGRNNSWDATQFISSLITALGSDLSNESIKALKSLREESEDGYSYWIKSVIAEQQQRLVEQTYKSPNLQIINAITQDTVPVSIADLQAYMIEELNVVQSKVKADDAESWQGFYDDQNVPYGEERCRDHLLGLLRQSLNGIELTPEAHVAADKRVDITCSTGDLRLPVEIKGQWHSDLWTSADKQLDTLYASDWKAHNHGIYLIFWFGFSLPENKRLKNPPKESNKPQTAEALRTMLIKSSDAAKEGRIDVFVLDIERKF